MLLSDEQIPRGPRRCVTLFCKISCNPDAVHAISLDPSWSRAYERQGKALKQLNRLSEAITAFEKCVELDPNSKLADEIPAMKEEQKVGKCLSFHKLKVSDTLLQAIWQSPQVEELKQLLKTILYQALRMAQKLGFGASPQLQPVYDSKEAVEVEFLNDRRIN